MWGRFEPATGGFCDAISFLVELALGASVGEVKASPLARSKKSHHAEKEIIGFIGRNLFTGSPGVM